MKVLVTRGVWRMAAVLALAAYSIALALGSLTPLSRQSVVAGGPARQAFNNFLHVPAYGLLACLWALAVRSMRPAASFQRDFLAGAAGALVYGAAMELAQTHVAGRTCSLDDFLLDVLGVALAAPVVWTWSRRGALRAGGPAA